MRKIYTLVLALFLIIIAIGLFNYYISENNQQDGANHTLQKSATKIRQINTTALTKINYQKYNIAYMNDKTKAILTKKIGLDGKTAFYLPPTKYINVSKGTKYGVAFAINNLNPSPNGNRFAYNFSADSSVVEGCNVSTAVAQSWIERGWTSFGKISKGWVDAMTIYFAFPASIKSPCALKYNFVITKDGNYYDSRQLDFNVK